MGRFEVRGEVIWIGGILMLQSEGVGMTRGRRIEIVSYKGIRVGRKVSGRRKVEEILSVREA